ncbi:AAA family ATPase [Bacillus cereus group sp. TH153LC]|uniref:deoxynucleotide monophosphate kinase family protein n=1 Tax=Bacillus cereus group sp. TH153LC TaxID=3018059 RepID=UPI0022E766EC|nr:AAA family ATPase [Bacillus cereus group sp. TH153LC]MDA1658850.1 AAA family ATPase [Bacillus cereus group sp. TH153LC]
MRIALTGLPRVGKDTVGEYLIDEFSYWRFAFGDYMKEAYFRKYPHMEFLPKDREHMIAFSQPLVDLYDRIWIDRLEDDIANSKEISLLRFQSASDFFWGDNIVITDLRQPHEEKWCRENGFTIVRITSEKAEERIKALGEKVQTDIDSSKIKADYEISNDGTLEDLHSQIDNLLDCLNESEMKLRRL